MRAETITTTTSKEEEIECDYSKSKTTTTNADDAVVFEKKALFSSYPFCVDEDSNRLAPVFLPISSSSSRLIQQQVLLPNCYESNYYSSSYHPSNNSDNSSSSILHQLLSKNETYDYDYDDANRIMQNQQHEQQQQQHQSATGNKYYYSNQSILATSSSISAANAAAAVGVTTTTNANISVGIPTCADDQGLTANSHAHVDADEVGIDIIDLDDDIVDNHDDDDVVEFDLSASSTNNKTGKTNLGVSGSSPPTSSNPNNGNIDKTTATAAGTSSSTTTSSSSTSTSSASRTPLPKEVRNLLAGGIAGMVAKSVVAPFERIKILYQVSTAKFHLYKVPIIAYNIIQKEGTTALWKGNTATMIRVFPYAGIQFMIYDKSKTYFLNQHKQHNTYLLRRRDSVMFEAKHQELLKRKKSQELKHGQSSSSSSTVQVPPKWGRGGLTPVESLLAGMFAGAVSVIFTYPLDLTRAQMAVLLKYKKPKKKNKTTTAGTTTTTSSSSSSSNKPINKGFFTVLTDNFKNRGFVGLFRGLTPTVLGILPYAGIAFSLNEQGKQRIQRMAGRDLTTIERMQCGAIAGLFAQSATYPLEVTRRRMQTIGVVPTKATNTLSVAMKKSDGGKTTTTTTTKAKLLEQPVSKNPNTMMKTIRTLYAEQGIYGFFKGVSMNWFKGPVAFSISFTTYDMVQKLLETDIEHDQKAQYIQKQHLNYRRRTTTKNSSSSTTTSTTATIANSASTSSSSSTNTNASSSSSSMQQQQHQ